MLLDRLLFRLALIYAAKVLELAAASSQPPCRVLDSSIPLTTTLTNDKCTRLDDALFGGWYRQTRCSPPLDLEQVLEDRVVLQLRGGNREAECAHAGRSSVGSVAVRAQDLAAQNGTQTVRADKEVGVVL